MKLLSTAEHSKASRLRGPRFLTSTSSASAEGANNIKAAKVTVRDLEGTEDSINHSSAAAASAPVKPQIGIDPSYSDRGSFYPPVRIRMEPQLKDADYRIQIV